MPSSATADPYLDVASRRKVLNHPQEMDYALQQIVSACRVNAVILEPEMKSFNIHEAKTHLSRLVEQAAKGESFVIAKAGKPLVKVSALVAPDSSQVKRLGFLAGQISVPDDFDRMGTA